MRVIVLMLVLTHLWLAAEYVLVHLLLVTAEAVAVACESSATDGSICNQPGTSKDHSDFHLLLVLLALAPALDVTLPNLGSANDVALSLV
jgi:hypothetical protein